MAVDFDLKRDQYHDRCKWYKASDITKMKLTTDVVVQGVFYARDTVPVTEEEIADGNVKHRQFTVTIETPDYIVEIETDDYVLYIDDMLWRVRKIVREDISEAKEFSRRPVTITTMELIR